MSCVLGPSTECIKIDCLNRAFLHSYMGNVACSLYMGYENNFGSLSVCWFVRKLLCEDDDFFSGSALNTEHVSVGRKSIQTRPLESKPCTLTENKRCTCPKRPI